MSGKVFTGKEKIGYGAACVGDTAIYNLLIIYGLFFLTDVVKLNSVTAGNIMFIATIWNAFSVGLIGYVSDHYPLKRGKRIPYMEMSILPMGVTLIMFFTVLDVNSSAATIYYTLVMAALMTAHSTFMVPYEALGADLTMDADGRMALRSYARFFMGIGNVIGVVFLLPVIDAVNNSGFSEKKAWLIVIGIIALLGMISQVITCKTFRNKTAIGKKAIQEEKTGRIIFEYAELLKIKPLLILLTMSLLVSAANVFCNSSIAYFMKFNLAMGEGSKAMVLGIMTAVGMIMTPIISMASKKYDKKLVMTVCYGITGAIFLLFGAMGINSIYVLCMYIVVFTIGVSAYWQLVYPMLYDISELDELQNNRRREALILSVSKIILKVSNAGAAQMLGIVLFLFNYDQYADVQSEETIFGIHCSLTFIPAALFILSALLVIKYPISEKYHFEIVDALEKRRGK